MLTAEQMEEFNRLGMVRMPGAIAKSAADAMLAGIWEALRARHHIHRNAVETWPGAERGDKAKLQQIAGSYRFMGHHHLPKSMTLPEVGSAKIRAALDQLLGAGNWQEPDRWGSLLVTFPESTGPWNVPYASWHLDFPASRTLGELPAVRLFTCLDKLSPGGGATVVVTGSHRLVQNLAREGERVPSAQARARLIKLHPWIQALCSRDANENRVARFMTEGTKIDGVETRVVEMTGEPGDVILAHPMMLHAPSLNCSSSPRFALSTSVFRAGETRVKLYP